MVFVFVDSIQQSLVDGEPENAYWIPGTENPADGLTRLRSEMGPIMALLETGIFQPGFLFFASAWGVSLSGMMVHSPSPLVCFCLPFREFFVCDRMGDRAVLFGMDITVHLAQIPFFAIPCAQHAS